MDGKKEGEIKWEFVPCGRAVIIKVIKNNIETNEESIIISICVDIHTDLYKEIKIERKWLHKKHLHELYKYGVDSNEQNEKLLCKLFQNQEQTATRINIHMRLGFEDVTNPYTGDKVLAFKAYKLICDGIESTYEGKYKIEPTGDYDVWRNMIQIEVIGRKTLEFAVVAGVAAVVKGFLRNLIGKESLLINLRGPSSIGKTSGGMLFASVGGLPDTDGLMHTWDTTTNALEALLNSNFGFPILFDEVSTKNNNETDKKRRAPDFTKIIYVVNGGSGKQRLNRDSTLKDVFKWCTVMMSTGEEDMLSGSSQNAGLRVRLLQLSASKWTDDARNADAIKSCVKNNYGFAAPMIAEYLLQSSIDDLMACYEYYKKLYIASTAVKDNFTSRVAANYALILLSAEVAKVALGIDIEPQNILDFILENEIENYVEKSLGKKAYDALLEIVNTHPEKFGYENKYFENVSDQYSNKPKPGYISKDPAFETWGKIEYLLSPDIAKYQAAGKIYTDEKIVIAYEKFVELMSIEGFTNCDDILKEWRDNGQLEHESDRPHYRQKIREDGQRIKTVNVFVIKTDEEMKDSKYVSKTLKAANTLKSKKSPPKAIKPKPITAENIGDVL